MSTTTYYSTKYWQTAGIQAIEMRPPEPERDGEYVYPADGSLFTSFKVGRDAFASFGEAVAAAENARKKKIVSLRKQVAALEAVKFEAPTAPTE